MFPFDPSWEAGGSEEIELAAGVFEELSADPDLRPLPYRLFRIPTRDTNAFALPGGRVGLTDGLVEAIDTEVGLALVLAHELGHHHHRHALRKLGRSLLFRLTLALLGLSGDAPTEIGLILAEGGYSRGQETEADEFAMALVVEHYGDAEGSLVFFEEVLAGGDESRWESFLSTHPLTEHRIAHLREIRQDLLDAR